MSDIGILCQGGMYNAVIRALQTLGLADAFGTAKVPIYCIDADSRPELASARTTNVLPQPGGP